jgi:hypothetical protein
VRPLLLLLLAGCGGTSLNAQSIANEQAGQVVAAAGYKAHPDGGPDQLRFQVLFCKGREVLISAGQPYSDAGVPCH